MNLTPQELKMLRACVQSALQLRTGLVTAYKDNMESPVARPHVEPKVKRSYMRFVAVEIPQLTALLNKLRGR